MHSFYCQIHLLTGTEHIHYGKPNFDASIHFSQLKRVFSSEFSLISSLTQTKNKEKKGEKEIEHQNVIVSLKSGEFEMIFEKKNTKDSIFI